MKSSNNFDKVSTMIFSAIGQLGLNNGIKFKDNKKIASKYSNQIIYWMPAASHKEAKIAWG